MKTTISTTAFLALVSLVSSARLYPVARQQSPVLGTCSASVTCSDPDGLKLECRSGQCAPLAEGKPCQNTLDCSTFTFCGAGAVCRRGGPGASCTTWRQCDLGLFCSDGLCRETKEGSACERSYNCGTGLTCKAFKCIPGASGENCRTDKDCVSGKCSFSIVGSFATGICQAPLKPTPSPSPIPAPPKPAAPKPAPAPAKPEPKPVEPKPVAPKPAAAPAKPATEGATEVTAPAADAKPAPGKPAPKEPTADAAKPATPLQEEPAAGAPTNTTSTEGDAAPTDTTTSTDNATDTTTTSESTPGAEAETATETLAPEIGSIEGNSGAETNRPICVGSSSHVSGKNLQSLLHPTMRMQRHPLRILKGNPPVRMLCHEAAGARLCASAHHVVEAEGKQMYMVDFCASRACSVAMDVPLNFKGPCGAHIQFMPRVRVTQHAGAKGLDAIAVARAECVARDTNRVMWALRTL